MSVTHKLSFSLNGSPVSVTVAAEMSTLSMIRDALKLTGTKYGCGEGECGACTILVDGIAVNACLMFAVECEGREVTTIEGVQTASGLNVLQHEFIKEWATQCGFCTPGMIMQGTYLLRKNPQMTVEEIKRGLEGNLCRCTGYKKIIDAIAATVREGS